MTTAIVRPATRNDLDKLEAMIAHVDPGMLTMPSSREAMAARIDRSLAAFARGSLPPQNECYFLVMEEDGELLGTASIFTNLGVERPFYSYRISRDAKVSPELDVKVELDLLFLVNDYHGDCELGTLFIERKARGGGRGRLLSFARLMLIAADPVRFGPKAMAEIRGFTLPDGHSPFWDAVGSKFFRMEYRMADVEAFIDHIDTVRETVRMSAAAFVKGPRPSAGLAANPDLSRFSVTQFGDDDDPAAVLARIGVGAGEEVSVYRLKASRP